MRLIPTHRKETPNGPISARLLIKKEKLFCKIINTNDYIVLELNRYCI